MTMTIENQTGNQLRTAGKYSGLSVEDYIAMSALVMERLSGFVSVGEAKKNNTISTRDVIELAIDQGVVMVGVEERHRDQARAALDWVRNLTVKDIGRRGKAGEDFLIKLRHYVQAWPITAPATGFLASLVHVHQRELENQNRKSAPAQDTARATSILEQPPLKIEPKPEVKTGWQNPEQPQPFAGAGSHIGWTGRGQAKSEEESLYNGWSNGWQGVVGQRLRGRMMRVVFSQPYKSAHADTLNRMVDMDGNEFVWFGWNCQLAPGQIYWFEGLVKDHELYRGRKTTRLTQCRTQAVFDQKKLELFDSRTQAGMDKAFGSQPQVAYAEAEASAPVIVVVPPKPTYLEVITKKADAMVEYFNMFGYSNAVLSRFQHLEVEAEIYSEAKPEMADAIEEQLVRLREIIRQSLLEGTEY
jgi:hypothetical protein